MKMSGMYMRSKVTQRAAYFKKQEKVNQRANRAEIVAWAIFFGVGVSYFITTLILATV